MTGAPSEDRFAHAVEMRRLLYGHLLSAALRAAAILRLPDLLHEGCTSMDGLARRAQAYPPALRRLLRVLAAFDVVVEHPDGTFGLTPLGETLRSDVPGTALPTALLTAEI
ncbi:methyltransferase family protein, partial [Carbonactinospora thermoautotrophica]